MSEEIDSLRAEVAALRAELADRTRKETGLTRRRLLGGGLVTLGAAGAGAVTTAPPAAADDGENLVLGAENTAESMTELTASTPGDSGFAGVLFITQEGQGEGLTVVAEQGDYAIAAFGGTAECISAQSEGLVAVAGRGMGSAAGLSAWSQAAPALILSSESGSHVAFVTGSDDGPPAAGGAAHEVGEIRMDSSADIWLCTSGGDPGTWTRLVREDTAAGRTVPIAPMRALDTRATGGRPSGSPAVPGQKKGPLTGGTTLTLDLAGVNPIPATATGVVGNLTITAPTQAGFLAAVPSGSPVTTSALNFGKNATIANAFTSRLGTDGLTLAAFGSTNALTYHLIVDITGYIT